jgi:hypothetical protein
MAYSITWKCILTQGNLLVGKFSKTEGTAAQQVNQGDKIKVAAIDLVIQTLMS